MPPNSKYLKPLTRILIVVFKSKLTMGPYSDQNAQQPYTYRTRLIAMAPDRDQRPYTSLLANNGGFPEF